MIEPRGFLSIASRFHQSGDEAERRTAVSRCYYALFNLVIQPLDAQGVSFKLDGTDHGRLIYYLERCQIRVAGKLASSLKMLRNTRNNADYQLAGNFDIQTSQFAFQRAQTSFAEFEAAQDQVARIAQAIAHLPPYRPRLSS